MLLACARQSGEIKKELTFKGIKTSVKPDKIVASVLLRNNGNVSLDVAINTDLKNPFSTTETIRGTYATLPQTVTELNFELKHPFWGGLYRVKATASYNSNLKETLGYGNNNKTIYYNSRLFFVAPKPLALLIEIIILLGLIAVIYWLVQKFWRLPRKVRGYRDYIVKEGDSLPSIAKSTNTSWKHLAKANKIKPPYLLKTGQKIAIPQENRKTGKKGQ